MEMIPAVLIFFSGLFSLVASCKDWDFFFENRKAYLAVKILKRKGARIFYGVLGIVLMFSALGLFFQL